LRAWWQAFASDRDGQDGFGVLWKISALGPSRNALDVAERSEIRASGPDSISILGTANANRVEARDLRVRQGIGFTNYRRPDPVVTELTSATPLL
jgi:hypothetical protein